MDQNEPSADVTLKAIYIYIYIYISFKAGESIVACVQIKKSENQTRALGSTKEGLMTFVKNHTSSFTKIRSR